MTEKSKKNKRSKIKEDDIASLLQRYSVTTLLGLLREVAEFVGGGSVKIDWEALAKKTTTGISNAREYQMLWRHLAYCCPLPDKLEDGALPDDDDSDLECEVEAFPNVSNEASAEAAACVKVMMASGLMSDPSHLNSTTVEAPLTINIPISQSFPPASESSQPAPMQGMNITVPISLQRQTPASVASAEGLNANGSRKKRRHWTEAEDMELAAAVKQYGEGNWATIVRGGYKGERTPAQLAQRWAKVRKQSVWSSGANPMGVQLSEAQQAARHAMNLALDPPIKNTIFNNSGGTGLNNTPSNPAPPASTIEALPSEDQSLQCPSVTKSSPVSTSGYVAKKHLILDENNTSGKSDLNLGPVTAAKVATETCIATQLDALPSAGTTETLPAHHQFLQFPSVKKPSPISTLSSVAKPHLTVDQSKISAKSELSSDLGRAAAVAGGDRIATQSDTVPLAGTTEALPTKPQSLQLPAVTKPSSLSTLGAVAKPHLTMDQNKASTKSDLSSDPVRAAAIAAGARIATQSDAASLFKAAQAKNAIHIIATSGSSIKSSMPSNATSNSEAHPNIRCNSSGPPTAPFSTSAAGLVKGSSVKTQATPSLSSSLLITSSEQPTAGEDTDTLGETKNSGLDIACNMQDPTQRRACISGNGLVEKVEGDNTDLLIKKAKTQSQVTVASSSNASTTMEMIESHPMGLDGNMGEGSHLADDNTIMALPAKEGEHQSAVLENGRDQSISCKPADIPSKKNDESSKKEEVVIEADISNGLPKGES